MSSRHYLTASQRNKFLTLVAAGLSLTAARERIGISSSRASAIAKQAGMSFIHNRGKASYSPPETYQVSRGTRWQKEWVKHSFNGVLL